MGHRGRAVTAQAVVMVLVVVGALTAAGCSDESRPLPVVEEIPAAIAAVQSASDTMLFREVNADTEVVRLFAAVDDEQVVGYLYVEGELLGPAPPQDVDRGPVFAGDEIEFDSDSVFSTVLEELDDPAIERFVITASDDGVIRYEVFVRSERGGLLAVQVGADGSVLGVVPR